MVRLAFLRKIALSSGAAAMLCGIMAPSAAVAEDDWFDFDIGSIMEPSFNRMPEPDPRNPWCDVGDSKWECTLHTLFPYLFPPEWMKNQKKQCNTAECNIARADREAEARHRARQGKGGN